MGHNMDSEAGQERVQPPPPHTRHRHNTAQRKSHKALRDVSKEFDGICHGGLQYKTAHRNLPDNKIQFLMNFIIHDSMLIINDYISPPSPKSANNTRHLHERLTTFSECLHGHTTWWQHYTYNLLYRQITSTNGYHVERNRKNKQMRKNENKDKQKQN